MIAYPGGRFGNRVAFTNALCTRLNAALRVAAEPRVPHSRRLIASTPELMVAPVLIHTHFPNRDLRVAIKHGVESVSPA